MRSNGAWVIAAVAAFACGCAAEVGGDTSDVGSAESGYYVGGAYAPVHFSPYIPAFHSPLIGYGVGADIPNPPMPPTFEPFDLAHNPPGDDPARR